MMQLKKRERIFAVNNTLEFVMDDYPIDVRSECIKVGELRMIKGGWSFFKKGQKENREIFKTRTEAIIDVHKEYGQDYKWLLPTKTQQAFIDE